MTLNVQIDQVIRHSMQLFLPSVSQLERADGGAEVAARGHDGAVHVRGLHRGNLRDRQGRRRHDRRRWENVSQIIVTHLQIFSLCRHMLHSASLL